MILAQTVFRALFLCAIASLLASSPSRAELRESNPFTIAGWEGGTYSDSKTGRFSHCAAASPATRGYMMTVSIQRSLAWIIGIAHDDWNYKEGRRIDLEIRFDGGEWFGVKAEAVSKDLLLWQMDGTSDLVRAFRLGSIMGVTDGKQTLTFDLTGTNRVFQRLAQCVTTQLASEKGRAPELASQPADAPRAAPDPAEKEKPKGLSTGTGFLVSAKGHIVTNEHVVDSCREITVAPPGDFEKPANLLVSDTANDLAVLKTDIALPEDKIARIRVSKPALAGEHVAVYGFPLAGALSSSGNLVEGNITAVAGLADNINHLQISAPIQAGNSGGPLLDFRGAVTGVVNAKLNDVAFARATGSFPQNVNFAIKANIVSNFLDAHSIPYLVADMATDLDLVAIGARAKEFTVIVICEH